LIALLGATACADRSAGYPNFRGTPAASPVVTVQIRSQNYADLTVYATRDGSWQRLGSVTGNTTLRMEVPTSLASSGGLLRFRVHAIGQPDATDYVTERISAGPGDVIEITVAPVLRMSTWTIR
jgi:hypothetical protein